MNVHCLYDIFPSIFISLISLLNKFMCKKKTRDMCTEVKNKVKDNKFIGYMIALFLRREKV